jgi:hypothetical protein
MKNIYSVKSRLFLVQSLWKNTLLMIPVQNTAIQQLNGSLKYTEHFLEHIPATKENLLIAKYN